MDLRDLYSPNPEGRYFYRGGLNTDALLGFIPAAIVALCIALVPAFSKVSPFSWFIAAPLGALCYWIVETLRGNKPLPTGSGD